MDEKPILSVRDLRTYFLADEGTTRAVDGVSFDVYAGRTLAVVGETGCGKSVTARSILRLVDPPGRIVSGEVLLWRGENRLDLTALPANGPQLRAVRGGDIGLVFQEPMSSFSPVHTIGNQISEVIRTHSELDKKQIRRRVIELLEMVRVPEPESRLDAYPWQLSGGLLQRAMIAMALAGEPRLLILDEPTTALDVITQAQILDLVRDLQERTGLAIILITHDLGVVAQMADDVVVMYLGKVAERGPVDTIFGAPRHPYTKALLQSIPSRHTGNQRKLATIAGSIPHPFDRPRGCPFHPRCTSAIADVCDREEAPLRVISRQHEMNCHHAGPDQPGPNGHAAPVVIIEPPAVAPSAPAPRAGANGRPADDVLLQVRHLVKEFAVQGQRLGRTRGYLRAVDDVTFEVRTGETFALVGESGSGKTTTSHCVLRALKSDSGEVLYRTKAGATVDLARLPKDQLRALRPEFQMIFQNPYSSLNPRMSILDIVGEPLLLNGVKSRRERIDRVEELLRLVGLRREYLRRFPHAFSGGQRQRIGIARALALNPRLVVADEPVSALDVSVQAQTLNLLMELQDRLHLTYLFVSHDLSVVRHISNRIGVMYAGELVEMGDAESILNSPRHPYTAALLAAIPRPEPSTRSRFNVPVARPAGRTGTQEGCRFQRRCQYATKLCEVERPAWEQIEPGRYVRCHHASELSLIGSA